MQNTDKRITLCANAILQEVEDEAVLLNLNSQHYYALNPSGLRMLQVLTKSDNLEQAAASLLDEYEVDPAVLRSDLQELVDDLLAQGLVEFI